VLEDYYENWKKRLQELCMGIWFITAMGLLSIHDLAKEFLENSDLLSQFNMDYVTSILMLFGFASPSLLAIFIYNKSCSYIDTKLWKRKFPQYDISGEWSETAFLKWYDHTEKEWKKEEDNYKYPIIIEQTCQMTKIIAHPGDELKWHSIMASWDENNTLNILYQVDYYSTLQEKEFPERRFGYNIMNIFPNGGEKPHKMKGKTWDCISITDKRPLMGDILWEREPTSSFCEKKLPVRLES
jgi:hypothetical protein